MDFVKTEPAPEALVSDELNTLPEKFRERTARTWPQIDFLHHHQQHQHIVKQESVDESATFAFASAGSSAETLNSSTSLNASDSLLNDPYSQPSSKKKAKKTQGQPGSEPASSGGASSSSKKPNPWGNESYADLIARALNSAPGGKLKLNEIYQWFADNLTYFGERRGEESNGWKVGGSFAARVFLSFYF